MPLRDVLALDGPSGTGKSTVARAVAARLGLRYLDTGAMYRGVTLAVLDAGVEPTNIDGVIKVAQSTELEISTDPDDAWVTVDGRRVDTEIRAAQVTSAVSAVSAVPEVRARLVAAQRRLIGAGGIVVEGRDIGTVVAPEAQLKVFLTAAEQVRAQRRAEQVGQAGAAGLAATAADLQRRDSYDSSRPLSPLRAAADAVEVDTSHLLLDEVIDKLVDMALSRRIAAPSLSVKEGALAGPVVPPPRTRG